MKYYIWNVLNEDLVLKQNVRTSMELLRYDSVWVRMKRSRQSYHDQTIEIITGQAMGGHIHLRKDRMFDFLQKMMLMLPIDQLRFGLGSGTIDCKLSPTLLLDFYEMQDHWSAFEKAQGMLIMIVTRRTSAPRSDRTKTRQETALLFSGISEKIINNS